ncbi:hypothetical protein BCV71DRAFT_272454 [Rhizopus microsporus]|uniref:Uncharacterized protein n=1 Tax=Rhizopus microsporus TaxID=58291 RepID=A0A1X0SCN9_RHIZD|nr:hypothetical protein BCV71DRAFT_272454 [Rhizopus microsporus]
MVFVKDWPGYRGQVLYRPPGSQPRRQRMQRLLSDLDIGSYRTRSKEIVGRQCIRRTEACVERLLLRLSWRYSRYIDRKERRFRGSGSGEHLFQMGDLESLYHWEWLRGWRISGRRWCSRASSERVREHRRN